MSEEPEGTSRSEGEVIPVCALCGAPAEPIVIGIPHVVTVGDSSYCPKCVRMVLPEIAAAADRYAEYQQREQEKNR